MWYPQRALEETKAHTHVDVTHVLWEREAKGSSRKTKTHQSLLHRITRRDEIKVYRCASQRRWLSHKPHLNIDSRPLSLERDEAHAHIHTTAMLYERASAQCALLLLLFVYTSLTGRGGARESDNEEILSLTGTQEDKVKRASPSALDDWFPFLVRFTELMHQLKYTHAWCSHPSIGAVSDSHKCSSVCVA